MEGLADRYWTGENWKIWGRKLGCTRIRMLGGENECDIQDAKGSHLIRGSKHVVNENRRFQEGLRCPCFAKPLAFSNTAARTSTKLFDKLH